MHFDQYGGAVGSFVWYWYERLGGFSKAKLPNPIEASGEDLSQAAWMHDWGGTAVIEKVSRGIPGRLGEMYEVARGLTEDPRPDLQRRPQGPRRPRRRLHPDRGSGRLPHGRRPRAPGARARQADPGGRDRHPHAHIETDEEIADRIRKVLEHVEPERVCLTTDCGLKALPRFCASEKLKALTRAAAIVRQEIGAA